MNADLLRFMDRASAVLVAWSCVFTIVTGIRLFLRYRRGLGAAPDSAVYTELAGLPLTVLQSVCFVMAAVAGDWRSMLLFSWWGPGFVAVVVFLGVSKLRRRAIDWHPWRYVISVLCKGTYVLYMAVFLWHGLFGMVFAFSVWIINDQFEKAALSHDADRLRRTFDDAWLFRIAYPAGLLVPWLCATVPNRTFAMAYGTILLILWLLGIARVARLGALRRPPLNPRLLRNMIYFPRAPR